MIVRKIRLPSNVDQEIRRLARSLGVSDAEAHRTLLIRGLSSQDHALRPAVLEILCLLRVIAQHLDARLTRPDPEVPELNPADYELVRKARADVRSLIEKG